MIRVSILGSTGYTGSELLRLLLPRTDIKLSHLTSRKHIGQKVSEVFPFLFTYSDKTFVEFDKDSLFAESDLVFICLPHGHAEQIVIDSKDFDVKIIDLGSDFRLRDLGKYSEYYQIPGVKPEYLKEAVYGLSEYYREEIKTAKLIANPGCFVTSALLGLLPIVKSGLVDNESIIIDSKSGVSGAGKSASVDRLLAELAGNFRAYNVLSHRHIPEIEQELQRVSQDNVQIQFTPHLLPIERGIFSTIYADLKQDVSLNEIRSVFQEAYQNEPFVHLLPIGELPATKNVKGTNFCQLQVMLDERTNRLVILSVIDNLGKGAAGQAVQNMNLLFNLPEMTGLNLVGLAP